MVTQINYKSTYKELSSNHHLAEMMASQLADSEGVYASTACRWHFTLSVLRPVLYNTMILCGQYSSGLCLVTLLAFELSKVVYSIVLQCRYRFLRHWVVFAWEMAQGLFLMAFLFIALLIHRMSFNDVIPSAYQTTGIAIVLISCAAEYVFLLIYVGIASVTYYKNRKVRHLYISRNKDKHSNPFLIQLKDKKQPQTPEAEAPKNLPNANELVPRAEIDSNNQLKVLFD